MTLFTEVAHEADVSGSGRRSDRQPAFDRNFELARAVGLRFFSGTAGLILDYCDETPVVPGWGDSFEV